MSARPRQAASRPRGMRIVSASGKLKSGHFLLTADHLMLEVAPGSFELMGAIAEGSIEVQLFGSPDGTDFVVLGERAVYDAGKQRLLLGGWKGTRHDGVENPPDFITSELVVPVDGSFFEQHAGQAQPA